MWFSFREPRPVAQTLGALIEFRECCLLRANPHLVLPQTRVGIGWQRAHSADESCSRGAVGGADLPAAARFGGGGHEFALVCAPLADRRRTSEQHGCRSCADAGRISLAGDTDRAGSLRRRGVPGILFNQFRHRSEPRHPHDDWQPRRRFVPGNGSRGNCPVEIQFVPHVHARRRSAGRISVHSRRGWRWCALGFLSGRCGVPNPWRQSDSLLAPAMVCPDRQPCARLDATGRGDCGSFEMETSVSSGAAASRASTNLARCRRVWPRRRWEAFGFAWVRDFSNTRNRAN